MDFKNDQTGNVDKGQRAQSQLGSSRTVERPGGVQITSHTRRRYGKKAWIIGIIVAVVVVIAIVLSPWILQPASSDKALKSNQYQAVFLTNGQVYFGKLASSQGNFLELKDVYYLQVQQSVQPAGQAEAAPQVQTEVEKATDDDSKVSLAKLGSELHGPEDSMQINREQVLFWENLNDNSKVVSAIKQHTGQ